MDTKPPQFADDKLANSVGLVAPKVAALFAASNVLELECGQTLGPIDVAYETYGTLNEKKDNVILVCHALSGDAHVAGWHSLADRKPGWWDIMVGPGKGIDTNKYFVVCSNFLGGCRGTTGPSSINPDTNKPWGIDFPIITIEDMVKVQNGLLDYLGVEEVLAVVGGSMGGMQVLEWAVRYPDRIRAAIPIATTPRLNAQSIAFDAVGRNAILADPNYNDGQYHDGPPPESGLSIARMVGHITYLSEQGMHEKFGRELRNADKYNYDFASEFSVETYLDYQGRAFVERFDANSYLYITKAMDYYDLGARYGSLQEAMARVTAKMLVICFSSDWLFTPAQSRQVVDALIANNKSVSYSEVNSPYGHDAFLLEPEVLGRLIGGFIASVHGDAVIKTDSNVEPYRQTPDIATAWTKERVDYDRIEELIEPNSRVLDLGCGRGTLLSRLIRNKRVDALGVEVEQPNLCECIERGLNVVDLNVEAELACFADQSYDYVVLSQTLQTLDQPDKVLSEMVRIGKQCIVSFPNFVHYKPILQMLLTGKTPVTEALPFRWYNSPNRHYLTIRDFKAYCHEKNLNVLKCIALVEGRQQPIRILPSLRAGEVIFVFSKTAP